MSIISDLLELKELAKKSHESNENIFSCMIRADGVCVCDLTKHNDKVDELFSNVIEQIQIIVKRRITPEEDLRQFEEFAKDIIIK